MKHSEYLGVQTNNPSWICWQYSFTKARSRILLPCSPQNPRHARIELESSLKGKTCYWSESSFRYGLQPPLSSCGWKTSGRTKHRNAKQSRAAACWSPHRDAEVAPSLFCWLDKGFYALRKTANICTCINIDVCVCAYIGRYVCMHTCMHACMHVCMYVIPSP